MIYVRATLSFIFLLKKINNFIHVQIKLYKTSGIVLYCIRMYIIENHVLFFWIIFTAWTKFLKFSRDSGKCNIYYASQPQPCDFENQNAQKAQNNDAKITEARDEFTNFKV